MYENPGGPRPLCLTLPTPICWKVIILIYTPHTVQKVGQEWVVLVLLLRV